MRVRYNEDLSNVKNMAKSIMDLVILSYDRYDLFLTDNNKDNLRDIIEIHEDIRRKASDMERLSLELMALQQPIAKDLKLLQMAIKLASTYKRIASHFEQASLILIDYGLSDFEKDLLRRFIQSEKKMAASSIRAFLENDLELAQITIENDQVNNDLFAESIEYIARENKASKIGAMELSEKVLLYKYFERLGDRIARVADLAARL